MDINISTEAEAIEQSIKDVIAQLPNLIEAHVAENGELLFEITDELIEDAVAIAVDSNNEVRMKVLEAIGELVDNPTDADAVALQEAYDKVTEFYVRKTIQDSANRIQSANVARQIMDDGRDQAISEAVRISEQAAEFVATSEAAASLALFDIATSLENGFNYFRYETSRDDAVRDKHRSRQGKVFAYGQQREPADVPELEYNCRCFAFPLTHEEVAQLSISDFFYPEDAPNSINASARMSNQIRMGLRFPSAKNNVEVTGTVGDYWEYNDFPSFKAKVEQDLGGDESKELVLDITSHGGFVYDGLAAYSYLSSLKNKVVANIYGYAGSAATAFIAAADHVTAAHTDQVLIHKSWGFVIGDSDELRKAADEMEVIDDSLVKAYAAKTGRSDQEIKDLMAEDSYISAERALEFGLIDEIREGKAKAENTPLAQAVKRKETNMSDEKQTQLEQEIANLKAENEKLTNDLSASQAQFDVLKAEIDELKEGQANFEESAKASAVKQIKDLADAQSRVKALGLDVDGETANDVFINALNQKKLMREGLNEEGVLAVFETIESLGDTQDASEQGAQASGKEEVSKDETLQERLARLQGDK